MAGCTNAQTQTVMTHHYNRIIVGSSDKTVTPFGEISIDPTLGIHSKRPNYSGGWSPRGVDVEYHQYRGEPWGSMTTRSHRPKVTLPLEHLLP